MEYLFSCRTLQRSFSSLKHNQIHLKTTRLAQTGMVDVAIGLPNFLRIQSPSHVFIKALTDVMIIAGN